MTSYSAFWFAFSLPIVLSQTEKITRGYIQDVRKVHEEDILNPLKSSYPEYSKEDNAFPATFQASTYGPHDFWKNNRRTLFEPHKESTTLPRFYRIMTSFFGGTKSQDSINAPITTNPFERPFLFKPTHYSPSINYIPLPKPIRASVIKLETITKSPNFYTQFYYDTKKYSPPLGNLLNHVLIENSKIYDTQDLSFHYQPNSVERINSTFDILSTVLPKPSEVPLTTLKPSLKYSTFYNRKKNSEIAFTPKIPVNNTSGQNLVQDPSLLQDFTFADFRISNLSKTVLNILNTTLSTQLPSARPYSKYRLPNKNISSEDSKNINWDVPNLEPISAATSSTVKISSFDTTTFKPIQSGLKPTNKSSVEVITNLTTEGLSATKKSNVNVQNYVNFFNVKHLINYEMNKMKTTPSTTIISDGFRPHPVNLNDELSLDAKILKDTNWDTLTTSETTKLVDNQKDIFQIKNKTNENEIITTERLNETMNADFFDSEKITTFIPPTIIDIFENGTIINFPSKMILKPTKTNINEMFPTKKNLCQTLKRYDTVQETIETNPISYETSKVTTQEPLMKPVSEEQGVETTIASKITIAESIMTFPKRNYRRRPKVINFTLYPTLNDFQTKPINRNNFPKRQKPNITLTFGNKINLKSKEGYAREVSKISNNTVGKRKRKLGKRRRLSRVQLPKVEKPEIDILPIL